MATLEVDLFDASFRDRLERRLVGLAAQLLALGGRVVIGFGSWSRPEQDQLLSVGRAAGAGVELHVLDPGVEELWRRLSQRNSEPGQVPIDRETLESYLPFWTTATCGDAAAMNDYLGEELGDGMSRCLPCGRSTQRTTAGEDAELVRWSNRGPGTPETVSAHIQRVGAMWAAGGPNIGFGIRALPGDVLAGTIDI